MIFVSTSCLKGREGRFEKDLRFILDTYSKYGIFNIELGAALGWQENFDFVFEFKKNYRANFTIHNFFPPPKDLFMLNIAAKDEEWRKQQVEFAKNSIEWCRKLDAPLYSLHFGFRTEVDGHANPLGGEVLPAEQAYENAKNSILEILDYAAQYGVKDDILLNSRPEEMQRLLRDIKNKNFGLLVDIGHLMITRAMMEFDIRKFIDKIQSRIFCLHLHHVENNLDHQPIRDKETLGFIDPSLLRRVFAIVEINNAQIDEIVQSKKIVENYSFM
jgi:sugar phosphate isomerase/epimerase